MAQLLLDHLYSFNYNDPKTKNLPIWDKHPLVFALDINFQHKSFLGLNLHWVPKKYREELLHEIIRILKKPTTKREQARLTYRLLLQPKFRQSLKGIRRYMLSRVTNLKSIPYDRWPKVLKMKQYKEDIYISKEMMRHIIKTIDS